MQNSSANLLLVTFDQWRGDWADPYQRVIRLPTIEKMAENSLVMRRCYTSSPQCVPARLSWLTGLAPSQLGVTQNCAAEAPIDAPSLYRELQSQGWHTEIIGKTHWTSHRESVDLRSKESHIKALGFDRVLEIAGPKALQRVRCELTDEWIKNDTLKKYIDDLENRYGTNKTMKPWQVSPTVLPDHLYPDLWLAERSLKRIEDMPRNKPWLLWISFVGPHEPFDTPETWKSKKLHRVPEPTRASEWISRLPVNCELKKTQKRWKGRLDPEDIKACRQDYASNLQLLDNQLGRIIGKLNQRQDRDKTAILVTSDHGEMLGDHEMLYKGTFLEASIRVPFIYQPPPKIDCKPMIIRKPIELTATLRTILEQLKKGGNAREIRKKIRKINYVCVEYANELLTIQKSRKLCCSINGELLWATNLRRDPREEANELSQDPKLLSKDKDWEELHNISKEEISKRKTKSWIWRDCTK